VSEGITIGGCYPPSWPRPPKPPVDEPVPDSLDERVEWMTWSHPELYKMVHEGIDLTGAMSVSATWARLGDELADMADELSKLLFTTAQAWEGEAAELAKESVSALSEWSRETAVRATEVCGCVAVQVDNVTKARNDMPPPPYPMTPTPQPSQITAFTSGDFDTAKPLVVDPLIYTSQERELHEQAARTMEQFQASSRDVYATVPQFAPPSLRKVPYGPPQERPLPPVPPQPPLPPVPPPPPVPRVPGGAGGGPVSGGGPGGGPGGSGPGSTGRAPAASPLAPGGGTGTGEPATRPAAASAVPARQGGQAPGMGGGVPMGGGGSSRGEDVERKNKYVEEDPEIWGLNDERVMPPVIGEVNRRA
jgi:hypothetical protein